MESMSDRADRPLPPARSRRTAPTGERDPGGESAPLPPYVPGRAVAVTTADAAPPPVEAGDSTGPEVLPAVEPLESGEADVLGGWQAGEGSPIEDAGDAFEDDFPFEPGEDEAELVLEAMDEEPEAEAEVATAEASAFPWELTGADSPEPEDVPADVAAAAIEAEPERSPWEELREAAAQSIGGAQDDDGDVAELDLSAAMDSAEEMAGEFADRLEALAERLRTDGLRAIDHALTEGDRLDTAVAGFLTAFIAARQR